MSDHRKWHFHRANTYKWLKRLAVGAGAAALTLHDGGSSLDTVIQALTAVDTNG